MYPSKKFQFSLFKTKLHAYRDLEERTKLYQNLLNFTIIF